MASVIVILSPLLKALSVLWFILWVEGGGWGGGAAGAGFHTDQSLQSLHLTEDAVHQNHQRGNSPNHPSAESPKTTTNNNNNKRERRKEWCNWQPYLTVALLSTCRCCPGWTRRPLRVHPTERTDTRRPFVSFFFFFLVLLYFHYFVMLLGSYSF